MIYYVSVTGSDKAEGTKSAPFRTVSHAASVAVAGDTVKVCGGTYREWVDPPRGGASDGCRIVFEAADGEHPIIKGSEIVSGWKKAEGTVWVTEIDNSVFGDFNPFATELFGDWLVKPETYKVHLGDVYLNGKSLYEAPDMDSLIKAERRESGARFSNPSIEVSQGIRYPDDTVYQWYAVVGERVTELYCNFGEYDPNENLVEVNVRPACFYPTKTGINYITVRGFEFAHAATQFAPPTADQIGMVGPHWSCGWIIENNCVHDSKCTGISLGKYSDPEHANLHSRTVRKPGYQYQLEAVFLALGHGWEKENVGSHTVRGNIIHDCGQAGIVGHLGCAFSLVEHNHIYNVNTKQEFWGHEVAAIKFHAAIDTVIANNNIHNCNLGLWLDWQAQGTRVTSNLFYENGRDLFIEVTQGPCTVDNNVLLSPVTLQNAAQGTAYVHNVMTGLVFSYNVLNRTTPYHFPHSTTVRGVSFTYGGDDRVMNNIILGTHEPWSNALKYLGANLDGYNTPEDYKPAIDAVGLHIDHNKYTRVPEAVWVAENAYAGYAAPFRAELDPIVTEGMSATVEEADGEWTVTLTVPEEVSSASCRAVTTERLGTPRITEEAFENPDGTPIDFELDVTGARRTGKIVPGAFAKLCAGENKFTVWKA